MSWAIAQLVQFEAISCSVVTSSAMSVRRQFLKASREVMKLTLSAVDTVNMLGDLARGYDRINSANSNLALANVTEEGISGSDERECHEQLHHRGDGKFEPLHGDCCGDKFCAVFHVPKVFLDLADCFAAFVKVERWFES